MTLFVTLLRVAAGVLPLIFDVVPPPDPERRLRREAMVAKKRWWTARRALWLAERKGRKTASLLTLRARLAKWEEALDRLGEDVPKEEQIFLAQAALGKV